MTLKAISPCSQIVFLNGAGIGKDFGSIAPQIKVFDVYYDQPPVVGLQIVGEDD